jgi:putative addiction module component (TIGR02574 family)
MDLIEELRDSIASAPDQSAELRITDEERALIDDRLAQYEADPSSSRPWSEVRAELEI